MSPTIKYLQEYLRSKDYHGGDPTPYFHKLVEEVGELSRAILLEEPHTDGVNIKGTVDEELGVSLDEVIELKENYNNRRYNPEARYDPR